MKKTVLNKPRYSILPSIAAALLVVATFLPAQIMAQTKGAMPEDPEIVAQVQTWNAQCLQCHAGDSLHDEGESLFSVAKNAVLSATSPKFAASNHGGMPCKNCHIGAFSGYPHTGDDIVRKAETLQCDECHAQEFFRIEKQVAKSVHSKNLSESFTCSTCHDPHVAATAKKVADVEKVVAQDNAVCLDCHNSDKKFSEFGGKVPPDKKRLGIDDTHKWLPNAKRHFEAARCNDCHTPPVSSKSALSVSHEILNKDKAQKNCTNCHKQDSALRLGLYRHIKETDTKELGFINAAFTRNSYVIGATRNIYLDLLGLIVLGGTIAGLAIHGLLRIITARRRKKS